MSFVMIRHCWGPHQEKLLKADIESLMMKWRGLIKIISNSNIISNRYHYTTCVNVKHIIIILISSPGYDGPARRTVGRCWTKCADTEKNGCCHW